MMWETCTEKCKQMGVQVIMNCGVKDIALTGNKWKVDTTDGNSQDGFDHVLSSAPMRELIAHVSPRFPEHAFSSSQHLVTAIF
jgi:protoporphyrinogen oxidase